MEINDLTHTIIGCAYKVHNVLGFGFLERVYENALRIELEKLGIRVLQQHELNVWYDNQIVGDYVPDLWLPEKLIIEVNTDGTIHPEEAVKQASRILIQHLMIITDENITFDNKEEKKEDLVDEQTLQLRKVLKTPLEDLDLSVRAFNCLKAAKINSLSELVQYEQEDLMKFRNFGQKSLAEIEQVLTERGLHFGMDLQKLGVDADEL